MTSETKREKIINNIILGVIIIIVIGLYFSRAAVSIGTGALGFLGLINLRKHHFKKIFDLKYSSIIIIYILFLLSVFVTEDFKKYQQLLFFQLPIVLIPVFFISNMVSVKNTKITIWTFILLTALVCLGTLLDFLIHYTVNTQRIIESKAIPSITGIPHYQFSLLIIIAMICCYMFWREKSNTFKKLTLVLLIFFVATLHILAYRTGLFCFYGLVLFCFFRLLITTKEKKKLLLTTAIGIFLLIITAQFFTPLNLKIKNSVTDVSRIFTHQNFNNFSISQRYAASLNAVEIIKKNFWFGVSPADLGKEMEKQYQTNSYLLIPENRIFIHNQYLFYLGSFGILAFLIWITLWIRNIYSSIQFNLFSGYILLATSLAFLVDNFFELQIGFTSILLFYYLVSQSKFSPSI